MLKKRFLQRGLHLLREDYYPLTGIPSSECVQYTPGVLRYRNLKRRKRVLQDYMRFLEQRVEPHCYAP